MNVKSIEKIDKQKIYQTYDNWPKIAKFYYGKKMKKIKFSEIDHIVFSGMGGSGALGDVISSILSKTNIHVSVIKGYNFPNTINSKTLVVVISISGNTDESLSILQLAHKKKCKLIAFTSGGKMEDYCLKENIEFRKIEKFHSPRASFPAFLYSMLNVLSNIIPLKRNDVFESIKNLQEIRKEIYSKNLSNKNPALLMAKWIVGIPLIYYPFGLESAAIRFKNSLQENSKTHVIVEDVIESCHNGIVAWEKKSNVQPILIKGQDDHIKTKQKWKILEKYFKENKIEFRVIETKKGSILTKIINLIYLLDYITIYKAILEKVDPTPVRSIEYIKNETNFMEN